MYYLLIADGFTTLKSYPALSVSLYQQIFSNNGAVSELTKCIRPLDPSKAVHSE